MTTALLDRLHHYCHILETGNGNTRSALSANQHNSMAFLLLEHLGEVEYSILYILRHF